MMTDEWVLIKPFIHKYIKEGRQCDRLNIRHVPTIFLTSELKQTEGFCTPFKDGAYFC